MILYPCICTLKELSTDVHSPEQHEMIKQIPNLITNFKGDFLLSLATLIIFHQLLTHFCLQQLACGEKKF